MRKTLLGLAAYCALSQPVQAAASVYFDGYAPCDGGQLLCFYKTASAPNGFHRVLWGPMPLASCEELVAELPIGPRAGSGCLK